MLVLGGGVRGGRVLGPWRGLSDPNLLDGRDLPPLTDHRTVFAEALVSHIGLSSAEAVFPGWGGRANRVGLFGA
jgi:uncharacterized protein (DUF1501 family)